ncbi:MAG: ABC transporter permease subunit [Acidimicrobiia bacterium]
MTAVGATVARVRSVVELETGPPVHHRRVDSKRVAIAVGGLIVFTAVLAIVWGDPPAGWWDFGISQWVDHVNEWLKLNRTDNWAFVYGFTPFAHFLTNLVQWALDALNSLTWLGVLAVATLVALRVSGWSAAITAAAGTVLVGALQLWDSAMITVAMILVSVAIAIVVGVPLGVLSARRPAFERATKVLLDGMQVLPAFCYLLPLVLLFDIGYPPAIIATVVFALPATIRLTAHGIRGVPEGAVEVGTAFGADKRQTLRKIEIPMARSALLLALNQTVNLALGVVVIAALVGAEGLGNDVLKALQTVNVGAGFQAGLAIVVVAIVFDRMSRGRSETAARAYRKRRTPERLRAELIGAAVVLVAVVFAAKAASVGSFPTSVHWSIAGPVNNAVEWIKDTFGWLDSVSNFFVIDVLTPMRDFLTDLPWWGVAGGVTAIGWASGGRRVAVTCAIALLVIAGLQTSQPDSGSIWFDTMDTLTQVLVAVVLSVAVAIPLGIVAGLNARFLAVIRPVLDAMQVLPAFVYLVPVIALFNPGRFPGIVASLVYALPLGIRLTALGIRDVPPTTVEAAQAMGATRMQILRKVQLPQAWRSILLGVNQTILMVFSVVVIAGLIGGGALGLDVVYGLTKSQLGLGIEAGIAIVALAVVLDRITQAWGGTGRQRSPRAG